jgi:hypothetical protein
MSENYIVVFAGSAIEAEVMKGSLEAAGLDTFLKDELIGSIAPWTLAGAQGAVKVMVKPADAEEARAIIAGATAEVAD